MKNNEQTIKDFDAVKYMREERNKIDKIIEKMSKEELLEYFKNKRKSLNMENHLNGNIFQL